MRRGYGVVGRRDGDGGGDLLANFSYLRDTSRRHGARRFAVFVGQSRERHGGEPTAGRVVADLSARRAGAYTALRSARRMGGRLDR